MKYRVVFPIVSDRRYAPGETIEPAAGDAAAWLELGIIAELDPGEQESDTPREGADPEPGSEAGSGEPAEEGDDPGEGSDPSPGDPDRHAAIVDAIRKLDPKDPSLWSGRGKSRKPRVDAIEAVLEYDITADERDAAWAELQAGG